jgi:hypothetical protein
MFPPGARKALPAWRTLADLAPGDVRAAYLVAHRLKEQSPASAVPLLQPHLGRTSELDAFPELRRQADRLVAVGAYRSGDTELAHALWTDLAERAERPAERRLPEEWLRRIARRAAR